ncbi:uroporphyrinogen-III synthase [Corynebacterium sp. ES2730-CONJ]|uniref:uroporphyrinogen-III synthase n=1 Tax=Corynebacterium sp. ES2730-CONJ TaxID=2973941 RepID=UPI00216B12DD|nr:uroporphyrinogen-III synthase [Corynebacterium sp. ES2730-CONJ]MCS4531631.1 uroporphyrinogen-III synthase [Corynebacterium sp. ES2730-CONJ]
MMPTIVVPRALGQAQNMVNAIEHHGMCALVVPMIAIKPTRDQQVLSKALQGAYEWVIFTSTNAVDACREALPLHGVKIAAVGVKTARALEELGQSVDVVPPAQHYNATGLLTIFPPFCAQGTHQPQGAGRVLLPRGNLASPELPAGLTSLGYEVDCVEAYRTVEAPPPPPEVLEIMAAGDYAAICLSSGSMARHFVSRFGLPPQRCVVGCIGPRTLAVAEELGLHSTVMPPVATVDALVRVTIDQVRSRLKFE